MAANIISLTLKQQRNINNMTPEQVVSRLQEKGFSISTKALYAYEAGTNIPKVPVFLALCDIYNINDVMGSFGFEVSTPTNEITPCTIKAVLCTDENDWDEDQYSDFFKAIPMQKIEMFVKWGIPSFTGYDEYMNSPEPFVLSDSEIQLIKKYRRLDPRGQAAVLNSLEFEYASLPGENTHTVAKEA